MLRLSDIKITILSFLKFECCKNGDDVVAATLTLRMEKHFVLFGSSFVFWLEYTIWKVFWRAFHCYIKLKKWRREDETAPKWGQKMMVKTLSANTFIRQFAVRCLIFYCYIALGIPCKYFSNAVFHSKKESQIAKWCMKTFRNLIITEWNPSCQRWLGCHISKKLLKKELCKFT